MANIQVKDAQGDVIDVAASGAGTSGDPNIPLQTSRQESYGTIATGELQGSATALQCPNVACKMIRFTALANNVGNVYLGGAGVTIPNGTTDTTSGLQLAPGADSGWIPVSNLNVFYRIADNAGDDLTYLALVS